MQSFLGTRPFNWEKRIYKDRFPNDFIYSSMYATEKWDSFTGTQHLFEKVHVTDPNDNGLWTAFNADPCLGAPCNQPRFTIGHGVEQIAYGRFKRDYQSQVFCLDQINTIEEAPKKLEAIIDGYREMPDNIVSTFLRAYVLQQAGTVAQGGGLFLTGVEDASGNPASIDVTSDMFAVSEGQSLVGSNNSLLVNLNANGDLTALGIDTTAELIAEMGQLSMEWLGNQQEDLAANGYHNREWLVDGKFSITVDANTKRRLREANPALSQMYSGADFAKGGAFYSYGFNGGMGDWLFKEDKRQMRFRFRADLDGKTFSGGSLSGAIWVEEVKPYNNVATTFGLQREFSQLWKSAPIRMYHVYNREARVAMVGDITSVNSEMKFGLARSFMGKWTWKSPDVILYTDPNTGSLCTLDNVKKNMGFFLGEYDLTIKTMYQNIERVIFALGEPQQSVRIPNTVTPISAPAVGSYESLLPYNSNCAVVPGGWTYPSESEG